MTDVHTLPRALTAQVGMELRLTLRRGESLLITLAVPVLLLVFFSSLSIVRFPGSDSSPVGYLLPGMLALAVISNGMVSVGIATAYERYYGVLKLLGSSPLPRAGLIVAKVVSVIVLEVIQLLLLLLVAAVFYGWRPGGSLIEAVVALLVGTASFTGLGLAMAGGIRAEITLAGANGLYLLFLLLGNAVLPLDHLPGVLQAVARVLPATPLTDALRSAMTGGTLASGFGSSIVEEAIWGAVLILLAALTFKWE
ncbi:MAG: ABC transporter permease [Chloroflexi bacterium]|nr:ABC transporter permease [Chloroflexota bacterium]